MYHYTESGLQNVYLANGFKITQNSDGEEEIFIENIHGLHKAIGKILASKLEILNGDEIKFIRHTMNLSQKTFALFLGVEYQSVLGWEKEKRSIPKTADRLLKALFLSFLEKNNSIYDLVNNIATYDKNSEENEPSKICLKVHKKQWASEKKAA